MKASQFGYCLIENTQTSFEQVTIKGITHIYDNMQTAIVTNGNLQEYKILTSDVIELKTPTRHLAIGFAYRSLMQPFPLIFPEEVEHSPKFDTEIGIKLYNAGGGYIEGEIEGAGLSGSI